MKKADFKYEGNPTGRKVEVIYGTVILKDDGKVSVQGVRKDKFSSKSYAAHYHAGELAKAIVAADFNHPAVTKLIESNSSKGLVAALYKETAQLKEEYVAKCKEWEALNYEKQVTALKKVNRLGDGSKKWFEHYGITYVIHQAGTDREWYSYDSKDHSNGKRYYEVKNAIDRTRAYVKEGLVAQVAKAEKNAINHYNDSIAKLASRLNQKGVTDDSKFTVTSAKVKMNFECYIYHEGGVTRAWTIIASGPIIRPHYRYLVK